MPDREKVIAGLESCRPGRDCDGCPYHELFMKGRCNKQMEEDALALLKEKMPQVMTLDEIMKNGGEEPIYLECPDVVGVTPVIYQPDAFEDGYLGFSGSWRNSGFYHGMNYGITWRAWTSRPSPEQMRDTPWKGEEDHEA